jgi:hypothetical protein
MPETGEDREQCFRGFNRGPRPTKGYVLNALIRTSVRRVRRSAASRPSRARRVETKLWYP